MAKILITGIRGFTGSYLAARAQADGHRVIGLARSGEAGSLAPGIELIECELDTMDRLTQAIASAAPEYVVHLAGISHLERESFEAIYASNLLGVRYLLQALANSGAPIGHVLLASSANVYGNGHWGMLREDLVPAPVNDYGISKRAAEDVARLFRDRLPITIVRPFNYTGIGQSDAFVIPKIVSHAKARAPGIRLGNIRVQRDFSDVRGVADAYVRLLGKEQSFGNIYNVCSGSFHSLEDILGMVADITGYAMPVECDPSLLRKQEIARLYGSKERLESVIGPLAMPLLRETLMWMLGQTTR